MPLRNYIFAASLFLFACVPAPRPVDPEEINLPELAQTEIKPQRAASIRLTEEGRVEMKRGKLSRAKQKFSQAIEVDASNPFAYFYLGLAQFRGTSFEQAAELFSQASALFNRLDVWRAESLAYRGESLIRLSLPQEAKKEYRKALVLDPQNRRAREGLEKVEADS